MQAIPFCPETRTKENYIVFGKYVEDKIGTEIKQNYGVIVVCPNMVKYPKHFIPKAFYEKHDPTQLQNYMIDDLDYIDSQTGSTGAKKIAITATSRSGKTILMPSKSVKLIPMGSKLWSSRSFSQT